MFFPGPMPRMFICVICEEETTYEPSLVCRECQEEIMSLNKDQPQRSLKEMSRKRKKRKQEHRAKLARKHAKSTIEKEVS